MPPLILTTDDFYLETTFGGYLINILNSGYSTIPSIYRNRFTLTTVPSTVQVLKFWPESFVTSAKTNYFLEIETVDIPDAS
jgi:hypothetical protein